MVEIIYVRDARVPLQPASRFDVPCAFGLQCGVRPWWLGRACIALIEFASSFASLEQGRSLALRSCCLPFLFCNSLVRRRIDRVGLSLICCVSVARQRLDLVGLSLSDL